MKSPSRSQLTRASGALVLFALAAIVIFVFWQQFFGYGVFIGESDRLNSYLNIRLWEFDNIRKFHHVPSWNDTMFGGFPTSALHWMYPGTDPVAAVLQIFSRENIFWALGYFSIFLVLAASLTSYCYFLALVQNRQIAVIGGLSYALSVISLHRIAQVDNAYLTLVLLPLLFLSLRRSDRPVLRFVTLALCMTALAFWGFLQEVAYVYFFCGVYVLYRAISGWRSDRRYAIESVVYFAAASTIAIMFALPRLLGVAKEVLLVSRTSSFQFYGYPQLLRFFHEGIYGRTFEENRLLGNGMNVHEGLQLGSSTAASIVVCVGIFRPKGFSETLAMVLFASLFIPLVPSAIVAGEGRSLSALSLSMLFWAVVLLFVILGFRAITNARIKGTLRSLNEGAFVARVRHTTRGYGVTISSQRGIALGVVILVGLSIELVPSLAFRYEVQRYFNLYIGILITAALLIIAHCIAGRSLPFFIPRLKRHSTHPWDTTFHLFALVFLLFAIVTPDGYRIVFELFGKADFTHSRLSIITIFSFCSLLCVFLKDLLPPMNSDGEIGFLANVGGWRAIAGGLAVALVVWIANGAFFESTLAGLYPGTKIQYGGNFISKVALLKVLITTSAILVIFGFAKASSYTHPKTSNFALLTIALWIGLETISYAHFKVAGPHTWTYPLAFRGFNYLNVPPDVMRPPSSTELEDFAAKFETDKYRLAFSGGDLKFDGSKTAFVSSFWQANSIGGYGTGVPNRLALLPWPAGVQTLRSIEFLPGMAVNTQILAMLNVKYLLEVTSDLYFNVGGAAAQPAVELAKIDGVKSTFVEGRNIRYVLNPTEPLDRHFLVGSVVGTNEVPFFASEGNARPDGSFNRPTIYGDRLKDLYIRSYAEGFEGSQSFDASGPLDVKYKGDTIDIKVAPSQRERFIVLNMRFHPDWRVKFEDRDVRPFPTNITMMGFRLPAGLSQATLRFQPLSSRLPGRMVNWLAALCLAAMVGLLLQVERRRRLSLAT